MHFQVIEPSTLLAPYIRHYWVLETKRSDGIINERLESNRYLLGGTSTREFFLLGLIILSVTSVSSVVFAVGSARRIKV